MEERAQVHWQNSVVQFAGLRLLKLVFSFQVEDHDAVHMTAFSAFQVFDARKCKTAEDMFQFLCAHLKFASNGGNLRYADI